MDDVKRIAKNTTLLAIADIINKVLSFVLIIYVARYLGVSDFGIYSFAFSFSMVIVIFSDMGLNLVLVREIARNRPAAAKFIANAVVMKSGFSFITFFLIYGIMYILDYPPITKIAVYSIGIYAILLYFTQLFRSVFRAFERMEFDLVMNSMDRILAVTLVITALVLGFGLLEVVLVFIPIGIFGLIVSVVITSKFFTKVQLDFDLDFSKNLIREAIPFGLVAVFSTIYFRTDVILLFAMKGAEAAGWYGAAFKPVEALIAIPAVFVTALFPHISRLHVSSRKSLQEVYKKALKYLFLLGLPIAVGTTLLADRFILLFYGESYINSVSVLQILIWAVLFIFVIYVLSYMLGAMDKQQLVAYSTGIGVLLNVILNLILIPVLDCIGAALASVFTQCLVSVVLFYYISKHLCRISLVEMVVRPIFAVIVMGLVIISIRQFLLPLVIFSAICVYIGVLYITKYINKEDISLFKQIL